MAATMTLEQEMEAHRSALTGYCYRMIGSGSEAEDAVQETMVRAWRAADKLQERGALKAWLFRIANNVCLDMLQSSQRRAIPMEMGPSSNADAPLGAMLADSAYVRPIADAKVLPESADPAELAAEKETLRLAFVAALQHLPAKQRAVLILREVLRWQASEVATLLDTSVAAVNSALQRARATLADIQAGQPELDADQSDLLARYVDAFERYDIDAFIGLLHEDAIQSMPPFTMWLRGAADIGAWMRGVGSGCEGSRLITTSANGSPAAAQYRIDPDGGFRPWGLHVLDVSGGRICEIHTFLDDGRQFAQFGLPTHLPG